VLFSSPQLGAIKNSIWRHEESNGYPQTSEKAIEDRLCQNHPAACSDAPNNQEPRTRKLHVSDIVRGTKVIASFKLQGSPLVPHEQAEARAAGCAACKKNVDYSKPCSGICEELAEVVRAVVGGATTKYDYQLKACEVCGCANVAQIHVPADILSKGVTPEMLEEFRKIDHCWKGKELAAL
jgi:hypothetical protein